MAEQPPPPEAPQPSYNAPATPYRQFDWEKKPKTYIEATDPSAYSGLLDSYRDSYLGATGAFIESQLAGGRAPKDWDPLDHIPDGYDEFVTSFVHATSPQQMDVIKRQIDERLALRLRRERRGFWSTFGSDMAAGIFDPTNLIAGPALKGAGLLGGTAKGALFVGGIGATQEAVVWATDPSMLPEEGQLRVVGGALGGAGLGGLLGGLVGGVTGRSAAAAAPAPARQISRAQIITFVQRELEGAEKQVDWKGSGGKTKYGIAQDYNPEIKDVYALTEDQAHAHAQKKYWLPEFDKVDPRIAAIAFDAHYINSKTTALRITKAGSVEEALRIYRAQLMKIADTVPGKAKFRKGWNNRVDKLAKFVGGPNNQASIITGARQPSGIVMNDRGYMKFRNGPTNIVDEAGNYVAAALVRKRQHAVDDFTLVPVEERPFKYETVSRQTARNVDATRSVEVAAPDGTPRSGKVNRPQVKENVPPKERAPRVVNDGVDAAIELDRLERGDAAAARMTAKLGRAAPAEQPPRFELGDHLPDRRQQVLDKLSGIGRERADAHEMLMGDDLAAYLKESDAASKALLDELESLGGIKPGEAAEIRKRVDDGDYEGLPFTLEQASKQLPDEDAAFLIDVVEAKGLMGMNQPELDQLYQIIAKLPAISTEAAQVWMGRSYKGGKLTIGQIKGRMNRIIEQRYRHAEIAENYERDVAPFDKDKVRDDLDLAMDEKEFEHERALEHIDQLKIDRQKQLDAAEYGIDPDMPEHLRAQAEASIRRSWNKEYQNAMSLAQEWLSRLRSEMRDIRAERKRIFGRFEEQPQVYSKEMLEGLTEADRARVERAMRDETLAQRDKAAGGLFADVEERWQVEGEPPEDLKKIWAHDKAKQRIAQFTSKELKASILDYEDQMLEMEENATRWVGRDKVVSFNKAQKKRYNSIAREKKFYENRLMEVESFEKQIDDFLPFRLPDDGQRTPRDLDDPDGEYIAVDVDALLASFPEKPWTQSVHGLPGMAEDAFATPEDWVNFVVLHETEHVQNPRMEGESIGAYETRINDRAMAMLRAGDAPWKPVDGWKERLVLHPTPIGQLMRLVENPMNYMWQSIVTLAGDYDLRLQRNIVEGGSSQAGGSVFQKTMRHTARAADFLNKESDLYQVYMTGQASDFGAATKAFNTWRASRKAAGLGKMNFQEFDRAVGRTQATGKPHPVKEVNEAAKLFNDIVEDMRRQTEEVGLLPGRNQIEAEMKATKAAIASIEQLDNLGMRGSNMLDSLRVKLEGLESKLDTVTPTPGKKGLPYFTRVWNVAAMEKNPEEIKRIFREGYQREGMSVQEASVAAQNTFESLMKDPSGQSIEVAAMAGELRSREIPVENDEVIDFIHTDAQVILSRYMRHTGGSIEMTRAYGDPAGDLEEMRVVAALEADGLSEGDMMAAMQIWHDMRDRIIGGFHGEMPMSNSNRAVRFAKRWTRTATMGMSGISQITDLVRSMWVVGPQNFAKGLFSPLFSQMEGMAPDTYAKAVGEGLEIEMGLLTRRMMDDDDWTLRVNETGIERLMGDLEVPFFILNGVTPFTNMMKRGVARAVPHMVIDRARKVTRAIHAGEPVPVEEATWLREHGIDEHDAQLLVKLPVTESKGGFIMADFDKWAAVGPEGMRGQDLLMGAISGNVRRAVSTPGPLNRPRIMDGVMINKADQRQAWADRWAAEQAEQDARAYVNTLYQQGFRHGDPDYEEAIANMVEAAGAHKRARLNTGSKGRKERPVVSLPFQLQSFAFSQSSKLLHSMLTGRDKHAFIGFMSMWGAGIMISWLKGEISGTNDNATLDEHIMRGFQNSGILSWMSIPLEGAKGLARIQLGETNLGPVNVVAADQPGLADQAGILGPTFGLGIGALEAMFGKGMDGKDLPASDRVYQLRKILPFGNMLYWNWLVRMGTQAMLPDDLDARRADQPLPSDEYNKTIEGIMGFQYGDVDPVKPIPEIKVQQSIDMRALDIEDYMAKLQVEAGEAAKKKKRGRAPRVDDIPVWERQF